MSCLKSHSVIIKASLVTSDRNHIQTSSRVLKKSPPKPSWLMWWKNTHVGAGVDLTFFLDLGFYPCPVCDSDSFCVASCSESLSSMGREDGSQKPKASMVLPACSPYWPPEAFCLALLGHLGSFTESSEIACLITCLPLWCGGWCHLIDISTRITFSREGHFHNEIYEFHSQKKETDTIHVHCTHVRKMQRWAESPGCIPKSVSFHHPQRSCFWWMRTGRSLGDRPSERQGRNHLERPTH